MDNILEIKDLKKNYKDFTLDNISLNLPKGYIMGLIGPNGAGKTTVIKLIMNMIQSRGGDVRVFGRKFRHHEKDIKNRIAYVGEVQSFYGNKTVAWTGKFISQFFKNWDTNTYEKFLTDFAISRTKKTRELSKGQKVKLALALALSHNSQLAILDEPTAGLDPIIRREVLQILSRFTDDENRSVLISSHITDDIARIADLITFIIDGRIILTSPKDDLLAKWKRIHFRKGTLEEDILKTLTCRKDQVFGSSGLTENFPALKNQLANGITRGDIKVENANLDDILISLVKGE